MSSDVLHTCCVQRMVYSEVFCDLLTDLAIANHHGQTAPLPDKALSCQTCMLRLEMGTPQLL